MQFFIDAMGSLQPDDIRAKSEENPEITAYKFIIGFTTKHLPILVLTESSERL